jgi:hypothetical protein
MFPFSNEEVTGSLEVVYFRLNKNIDYFSGSQLELSIIFTWEASVKYECSSDPLSRRLRSWG